MRRSLAVVAIASLPLLGACGGTAHNVGYAPQTTPTSCPEPQRTGTLPRGTVPSQVVVNECGTNGGGVWYPIGPATIRGTSPSPTVGTNRVTLPIVAGLPEAIAETILNQRGLPVMSRAVHSPTVRSGYVVGEEPGPGSTVFGGSTITLVVSSGR